MSKERPILFSGPMVRAILEGRKTQTRRVMKFDPHDGFDYANCQDNLKLCPYGQPGNRLWVRETWAPCISGPCEPGNPVLYRADEDDDYEKLTWTPSIHMPRWASRITLELTGVRVERVQDISADDACSEGIESFTIISQVSAWRMCYHQTPSAVQNFQHVADMVVTLFLAR